MINIEENPGSVKKQFLLFFPVCLLRFIELVIFAPPRQKLLVPSFFQNPAVVEHNDPVRMTHGGQAVRDENSRTVSGQFGHGLLNLLLRLRIQRRRGLIPDEHRRVLQKDAGNGDPLLLSAGELHAPARPLPYHSREAARG